MEPSQIVWFLLPAAAAGLVQGVTGFGFGVIVVVVYPALIGVTQTACVSQFLCSFLNLSMVLRYRKEIQWRMLAAPVLFYFPVYLIALTLAARYDTDFLTPVLGGILIVLSVYFLFVSDRLSLKPTMGAAMICASFSAVVDAFFGIGGPPMVLYFLSATKNKREYLGTVQAFFLTICVYGTCMRVAKGLLTVSLLPVLGIGFVGMAAGVFLGTRIVDRVNIAVVKKAVYIIIGAAGLITLCNALL